jgi:hypothetical protein
MVIEILSPIGFSTIKDEMRFAGFEPTSQNGHGRRGAVLISWEEAYGSEISACHRCYNEGMGYFDFIAGTVYASERQSFARRMPAQCFWKV